MKQRIISAVIILVVLAGLGSWYWYSIASAGNQSELDLSGNIEATQVAVAAQTSGQITELKVEEGADVKTGDTLALLDDSLLKAQYDQTKAALALAQLQQNQAAIASAQAAVNVAEQSLKRATITSPIDGTVLDRAYEDGEFVTAGATLFVVANLETVNMIVYVPEDKLGKVDLKDSVDVTTDSYPAEIFKGTIIKIADQAEFTPANIQTKEQRVNLVFAVTIKLDNKDAKLKPGMPADTTIDLK